MEVKTKVCSKCGETKPIESFYRYKRMKDGHLGRCKACFLKSSSAPARYRGAS